MSVTVKLEATAGVVIGVAALPISILRADFDRARAKLAKINGALNVGTNMQAQFAAQLEAGISAAGPQGWLDWTLDFRNMLVHRGRRFLGMPWNTVLHEEGQRTLQGLMNSSVQLLETMATHLLDLWRWRRNHPGDLRQPAEQWKDGTSILSMGFDGYAPGSLSLIARYGHDASNYGPAFPRRRAR